MLNNEGHFKKSDITLYLKESSERLASVGLITDMQEAIDKGFPEQIVAILDVNSTNWEIEEWWPDIFYRLPNLERLDLSGFYNYLPEEIFSLQKLKILDFSCTYITCIPEGIAKLKSLEYLDLSDSGVREWPDALYLCKNIKYLMLSLTEAPVDLERAALMPNLSFLELSRYQIDDNQLNVFQKNRPDVELVII